MGNNAVKTIVLLMVLVVLSFIVGAQVSDSMKNSYGAFAIIGAIVSGWVMIYMGARVWQLLFILPPFVELLPISYLIHPISSCGFAPFAVSAVLMVCWGILWSLGRAPIRWRWVPILDIPFLVFVVFMVVAYVRHPAVLNVMDLDYDSIGGEEVVVLFFVLTYYICASMIPVSKQELEKCLSLCFKLTIVASFLLALRWLSLPNGGASEADGAGVRRFYAFYPLSTMLFYWAYSKYPVAQIVVSFRCWIITAFALVSALLTGQRQNMALVATAVAYIAALKREMIVLIIALTGVYIGLLYLGEVGAVSYLPRSAQRVLTSVPGLKLDEEIVQNGAGTMETRYKVWEFAMNPRTGAIKDYLWGDGFAISRMEINRQKVASVRGTGGGTDDNGAMTRSRNFHNGAIHMISRIGYVGLAWSALLCVVFWGVSIQVLRVWYRTETYPYIVLGLIHFPIAFLTFGYGAYTTKLFMFSLQSYFFLKLCYGVARESGALRPLFRERYVPMMIQAQARTEKTA